MTKALLALAALAGLGVAIYLFRRFNPRLAQLDEKPREWTLPARMLLPLSAMMFPVTLSSLALSAVTPRIPNFVFVGLFSGGGLAAIGFQILGSALAACCAIALIVQIARRHPHPAALCSLAALGFYGLGMGLLYGVVLPAYAGLISV
jgi:hypothetical protein